MSVDLLEISYRFAVAASLGLLVGLQREFAHRRDAEKGVEESLFAGVRTLTLVALLGFCSAAATHLLNANVFVAAMAVLVGALVVVSYYNSAKLGRTGLTSEVAALVVFTIGVITYKGSLPFVAIVGVTTAGVLAAKGHTEGFVKRLTQTDLHAFLLFCVLSVVILPMLPRTGPSLEPFTVLIPFRIGLMIVFISGVGFLGYVLTKIFGAGRGIGLAGAVGGLVSSTAVTLSLARRGKIAPSLAPYLAIGIVISWGVMFARMLLEVAAINPGLLRQVAAPLAAALFASGGYAIFLYLRTERESVTDATEFSNPLDLKPAITFGALFALILLVANAAYLYFGTYGVYVSALISGVADVDAITLSMSELAHGSLSSEVAARAIVIAAVSNTIVKGAIVAFVGGRKIRRIILPGVLIIVAAAIVTNLV